MRRSARLLNGGSASSSDDRRNGTPRAWAFSGRTAWARSSSYESLWETSLSIEIGGSGVSLSVREWVNSGLMALFFFVVGIEARRKLDLGELRERRRFLLPLVAACSGIAASAVVYLAFNAGRSSAHGWGIVLATDGLRARRPRARRTAPLGPAAGLHADGRRRGRHPRDRGPSRPSTRTP